MKYYDEGVMKNIRLKIEENIFQWTDVTTKKMYGCPCYKYKNKLFAFMVTDGIVLTKVDELDRIELSKEFSTKPFQSTTRTMKSWPKIPVYKNSDLKKIIPFIKKSYEHAKNAD